MQRKDLKTGDKVVLVQYPLRRGQKVVRKGHWTATVTSVGPEATYGKFKRVGTEQVRGVEVKIESYVGYDGETKPAADTSLYRVNGPGGYKAGYGEKAVVPARNIVNTVEANAEAIERNDKARKAAAKASAEAKAHAEELVARCEALGIKASTERYGTRRVKIDTPVEELIERLEEAAKVAA